MALKDLFIKKDENTSDKPKETPKVVSTTKFPKVETTETDNTNFFGFPKTTPTPSFNSVSTGNVSDENIAKAIEIYQNGFDNLNQQGYDFYEFYQAIVAIGIGNGPAYTMAFTMAKGMDKTITKEGLLSQSEFYSTEIMKSYNNFVSSGNKKREDLLSQKANENQVLMNDLNNLKQQQEAIRVQIESNENKLKAIDGKYQPKISEIDSKLSANDIAKDKFIQSIEQVKQGIINNVK